MSLAATRTRRTARGPRCHRAAATRAALVEQTIPEIEDLTPSVALRLAKQLDRTVGRLYDEYQAALDSVEDEAWGWRDTYQWRISQRILVRWVVAETARDAAWLAIR